MEQGQTRSTWPAIAAVNLAAVLFGAVALFGRLDLDPVWIVAARAGFAAAGLFALFLIGRRPVRQPWIRLRWMLATGALLALHWVMFFASVRMAGVAVGVLTVSSFPLFTIALQAARNKQLPSVAHLAAGLTIILAVAILAGPGRPETPGALAGAFIGLGSAALFAVFTLASQRLMVATAPVSLAFWQNLAAALVLAPFLPFLPGPTTGTDWLALAALGIFGTVLAHQLFLFALTRLPAAACGAFVSMEPVYAILLAALLFSEPVGPGVAAGAALIVAASFLLLKPARPSPD